jgi:crossover junction endodeoxyribonuclease RusA
MVTLFLPFPPSVNEAYGNNKSGKGKGRYPTTKHKAWLAEADACFMEQKAAKTVGTPVIGPYEAFMVFDETRRRWNSDLSNRIKVAEDSLKRFKLIEDDSKCDKLTVTWGPVQGAMIRVFKSTATSSGQKSKATLLAAG